jgi:addiction module HigA family antidote
MATIQQGRGLSMARKRLPPVHPGAVLLEEFLGPMGLTQYRLAKDLSVPARRINEIVHGQRAISADTALRLARDFGTSDRFWLNLQAAYDLDVERERLGKRLEREVAVRRKATWWGPPSLPAGGPREPAHPTDGGGQPAAAGDEGGGGRVGPRQQGRQPDVLIQQVGQLGGAGGRPDLLVTPSSDTSRAGAPVSF